MSETKTDETEGGGGTRLLIDLGPLIVFFAANFFAPVPGPTKIFFATDIHGSDVCLRKFLNAGRFYDVDAVVMGGDITGKVIVPVVEESRAQYAAHIFGRKRVVDSTGRADTIARAMRCAKRSSPCWRMPRASSCSS